MLSDQEAMKLAFLITALIALRPAGELVAIAHRLHPRPTEMYKQYSFRSAPLRIHLSFELCLF